MHVETHSFYLGFITTLLFSIALVFDQCDGFFSPILTPSGIFQEPFLYLDKTFIGKGSVHEKSSAPPSACGNFLWVP